MSSDSPGGRWHHAIPILRVASLSASDDYYVDVLGFKVDWNEGGIASLSRDDCCVFLTESEQGTPITWVWLGVSDVAALHDELRGRGARIRQPPTNHFWALEMQVEDLDGNVLRIGSDPLPGEPFGPFLDMHGRLWGPEPQSLPSDAPGG
jgi:catechol 2,3-dioxygenase-like lactoylglutathione lyase family enzyme